MLVTIASRLGSGDVELGGDEIARTILRGQQSTADVDLARDDGSRPWPVWWRRLAPIDLAHECRPRRRGEHTALGVVLDLLWTIESVPHAGDEIGGVADEPDVGAVVGGSRFSAGGIVESRLPDSSTSSPSNHVLHDVDHDPRFFRRHHLTAGWCRLPENLSLLVFDAKYCVR